MCIQPNEPSVSEQASINRDRSISTCRAFELGLLTLLALLSTAILAGCTPDLRGHACSSARDCAPNEFCSELGQCLPRSDDTQVDLSLDLNSDLGEEDEPSPDLQSDPLDDSVTDESDAEEPSATPCDPENEVEECASLTSPA